MSVKHLCVCAVETDEYHGYECEITGGACIFLRPNQDACSDKYGEVRHTIKWHKANCKAGDTVYHLDAGNHIWEFSITKIENGIAYLESNDELYSQASFVIGDMPKPRLFFTKEDAEEALELIN